MQRTCRTSLDIMVDLAYFLSGILEVRLLEWQCHIMTLLRGELQDLYVVPDEGVEKRHAVRAELRVAEVWHTRPSPTSVNHRAECDVKLESLAFFVLSHFAKYIQYLCGKSCSGRNPRYRDALPIHGKFLKRLILCLGRKGKDTCQKGQDQKNKSPHFCPSECNVLFHDVQRPKKWLVSGFLLAVPLLFCLALPGSFLNMSCKPFFRAPHSVSEARVGRLSQIYRKPLTYRCTLDILLSCDFNHYS